MKPDFNIGARNGLLEQKHIEALGSAIWLYLWFLDKQPKNTNKVLGGKPIVYEMVKTQMGISNRTYRRWLELVEIGGYISLLRTPRGYVVTINKAKKWVKSDRPKTSYHLNSDRPQMYSDRPKVADAEDRPKVAYAIKRDSLDITKRDSDLNLKKKELAAINRKSQAGYKQAQAMRELLADRLKQKPKLK